MARRLGALGLALVGALLVAATAYAAVIGSDNVIHGCYNTKDHHGTHELVLLDPGVACPKNMAPIQWNQTGPQGPQGSQGPQGPPGQQGPAGPPGSIPPASKSFTIKQVVQNGSTTFPTEVNGVPATINASLIYATADAVSIDFLFQGPGGTPNLDITFAHSVPYTNLILSQPLPVSRLLVTCQTTSCSIDVSVVGS
jgi:hypothetical protein